MSKAFFAMFPWQRKRTLARQRWGRKVGMCHDIDVLSAVTAGASFVEDVQWIVGLSRRPVVRSLARLLASGQINGSETYVVGPHTLSLHRESGYKIPTGHPDWKVLGGGRAMCEWFGAGRCSIDDW